MSTSHKSDARPGKFWVEFGPVLIFVVAYQLLQRNGVDDAIIKAGGVFMLAALAALAYAKFKLKHVSGMLIFTTVVIGVTVLLSFLFQDPIFLYVKPTIVNVAYGVLAIGGVLARKNLLRMLMGDAIKLPEKAWNSFAIRWGLFFFFCALVNEVVWRNFSEEFWVNFKLFGFFPLTILFTLTQLPFLMKHQQTDETATGDTHS